ncbi:unnamed protein product [Brachionus calyciflorus]|uniref:Uncharacterized protein n=1 Tax=Brachionus calyciflorus TaxID=104777 RepID=A0A814R2B0_9BILA|nr:unnamed protein product [Brachionus calyciflorus]
MDPANFFVYEPQVNGVEVFNIEQEDSCMPNSLNFYFGKRLFDSYEDFETKQFHNFRSARKRVTDHDACMVNIVNFKHLNNFYSFKADRFFQSNKHGNLVSKMHQALKGLTKETKYVLNYHYDYSVDGKKHYGKQGHFICIYKDANGFITSISNEDGPNDQLPYFNYSLNQPNNDSNLRLDSIRNEVGREGYKLSTVILIKYDKIN